MTTPSPIKYAFSRNTVVCFDRETIDILMKETGVNTLKGFNNLALAIVRNAGPERGATIVEGEEHLWQLGALSKDDAEYLASFLQDKNGSEIVDLLA